MSHTWIIDSEVTNHMTGNRDIISSFTPTSYSNFVVLADGSRTPIQGISIATTTHTLPLSFVFYLPRFPFNLLSVSKITKILNYTVIYFLTHCVFQELGTRKMISTGREWNGMYELELTSYQVTCISTFSAFEYHCRLDHPSLHILKLSCSFFRLGFIFRV